MSQSNDISDNGSGGKKPEFLAYSVLESKNGKTYWHKVGAVWPHRDGQGYELDLDSLPRTKRVSLRKLREERMQGYEEERQAEGPKQAQAHEQDKNHGHGHSR